MDERSYIEGRNSVLLHILEFTLRQLDIDKADIETGHYAWIEERKSAVNQLRELCKEFGDNNWSDDLHLGDVIEKHLARHLHRERE
ncbi:MAG: hypothetical protein IMY80_07625 [Chloroflexi bacterium]|nr:hypothetical protein [Chloroflexota bacterium]